MGVTMDEAHEPTRGAHAIPMLVALLGDEVQPFELLAARCAMEDGADWATRALSSVSPAEQPREVWSALKNRCKAECVPARLSSGDPDALAALLRYCAALAGALRDQGELLSSTPSHEIQRMLALVGPFLPAPWDEVFARACQCASGRAD